jgi:hypothetical protein
MRGIGRAFTRRSETGWTFPLIVAAVFAVALIVGHAHHEMWRDELHCFAVGRNATGLWDLLTGERRYDGHPFLWYYLLHLASRVTRSYAVVHVVTTCLAVAAAALWLRYARVPRVLRVLLLGTYLILFEYGIMNRAYTLGLALIFALCATYHPCRPRYVLHGMLLALLAAASFHANLLALALAAFIFSHGPRIETPDQSDGRRRLSAPLEWMVGLGIYLAGTCLVALTTWPPADATYKRSDLADVNWDAVKGALGRYWSGMFPAQEVAWMWHGFEKLGRHFVLADNTRVYLGGAWLALWLLAFHRSWRVVLTYALGVVLLSAGLHFVYDGGVRHSGHFFILTLACIWLHGRETRGRAPGRLIHGLLAANILAEIVIGVVAYRVEYKQPFSGSLEVASFIRDHHLERLPVVADPDEPATPAAVILDRPFFFPATGETTDFTVFHNRRHLVYSPELLREADRLARENGGTSLILTTYDISDTRPGLTVKLLHHGGPATFASDEALYIFEARTKSDNKGDKK